MKNLVLTAIIGLAILGSSLRAADNITLTGTLSDEICGAAHAMKHLTPAECAHECLMREADYVLVVKDKIYTLKPDNTDARADLYRLVGGNVTIVAEQEPGKDFIWVLTVTAAK